MGNSEYVDYYRDFDFNEEYNKLQEDFTKVPPLFDVERI